MNPITQDNTTDPKSSGKNKIKMCELSQYIFEVVREEPELDDEKLMGRIINKFGEIKS